MTPEQYRVLQAMYDIEEHSLRHNNFDAWTTPEDLAAALPQTHALSGDVSAVRQVLESLWIARRVIQITDAPAAPHEIRRVELDDHAAHSAAERWLATEQTDCRFTDPVPSWEEAAVYASAVRVRYRSR